MRWRKTFSVIMVLTFSLWCKGDPVVSNVRAEQRSGTKLMDIWYDVTGATNEELIVTLALFNGGITISASSLSGDIGEDVNPGTDKHIVWDAGADWAGNLSTNMRVKVTTASIKNYIIIDLSGGPSATSYPLSSLDAVPTGGWTDEHKTTKLVLRKIPAGTFTMGSPTGELGRESAETQHQVTLTKDFYIGVFEVTQRQWELVMGSRPSYYNNATYYQKRPVEQVSYYHIRENPANKDDPTVNWPANSAVNATSFMGKLRSKTGLSGFDLPTESQWEYACRAGTTTALNSGYNLTSTFTDPCMSEVGRYYYNHPGGFSTSSSVSTDGGTAAVGSYLANAWGLYDMHGNVFEWCLDWYGSYPGTVTDPSGASSGSYRVIRGGSSSNYAGYCRSAHRIDHGPIGWDSLLGFRAARNLP